MSTKTRNLSNIDGANVGNPDESDFTSTGFGAYADDAAFEAEHTPAAGSTYFNTTENCLREYNGTSWQYDKTIFSTQTDSTTTGSNQDITPSVDQIIRFTHGSLASIRGIIPTTQKFLYLVNDQASQAITIQNQAAGATAANRIITGNGADLVVMAGRTIGLYYDEDATRWRVSSGRVPSSALEVHASDAAYQTAHPGFGQGAEYFNSVSLLIRQYNGTAWQNDKTSYETQTDSTTTGASQDITPNTVAQVIRFTQGSLTSIRSIVPTNQTVVYFVNGQASQVITIKNEDTGATAANRIVTGTGADFSLAVGQMIALVYDSGGTRWRLAGAASSGGSGTGGINLITSPSTATGWSETGTVFTTPVTTTTSADLPLEGSTNSAIQFVATNSGAEASHYNSYSVTTSAVMTGKLQVDFFMRPGTGFAASEWTVSVYQGSTRQSLDSDSSGVTYIPNHAGYMRVTFDAVASTAYTLRFARISGTGSATLNVCNVFFGWPQGGSVPSVGKWQSYTPTSSWSSNVTLTGRWKQDTTDILVRIGIQCSGAPTTATLSFTVAQLLNGLNLTLNTADIPGYGTGAGTNYLFPVGEFTVADFGANTYPGTVYFNAASLLFNLQVDSGTALVTQASPITFGANDHIEMFLRIPIAEWAGVASTGPAPAEEFASNSENLTTAGGTASASNTVYGPNGSAILSYASSVAANNSTSFPVNFQYPIQNDDVISVEIYNGTQWIDAAGYCPYFDQNTARYGIRWEISGASQVILRFGSGGVSSSGATFGVAGGAWSNLSAANYRWRVRKTKKASLPYATVSSVASGLTPPQSPWTEVTVSSTQAGWTHAAGQGRAVAQWYQDASGNHRMRFNFRGAITSTSSAISCTFTITGVTVKSTTNFFQAFTASTTGTTPAAVTQAISNPASSTTNHLVLGIGAGTNISGISLSGDIELDSKPSWA